MAFSASITAWMSRGLLRNTAALYVRGLVALACGIFASRWVFASLGTEGYGIYVLLCGVMAIVVFVNDVAGRATERYLAVAVGRGEDVRAWFGTAVVIHGVLMLAILALGYPLTVLAVEKWLSVPSEWVGDAVKMLMWLFISSAVGVANTPCRNAMAAYGRIGEVALWGCIYPCINLAAAAWMVMHAGRWPVFYVMALACGTIVTEVLVFVRANSLFPECRISRLARPDSMRVMSVLRFAIWRLGADLGALVGKQGLTILVNKLLGPAWNASLGVARTVSNHADSLAVSLGNTLVPQLANEAGAGNAGKLARSAECYSFIMASVFLFFAVPIAVSMEDIFIIWLNQVPPGAVACAWWLMGALAFGEGTRSFFDAVTATGKVPRLYVACGVLQAGMLVAAGLAWCLGFGFNGMTAGVFLMQVALSGVIVALAERRIGTSWRRWLLRAVVPLAASVGVAVLAGGLVRMSLPEVGIVWRTLLASGTAVLVFAGGCWCAGRTCLQRGGEACGSL